MTYFYSNTGDLSHKRERKQQHRFPIKPCTRERKREKKKEEEEEEKKEKKADLLFKDRGRTLFMKKFVASRFEVGGLLLNSVWALEI